MLPLGQRLNPPMSACLRNGAFLAVPWDGSWLTISGAWLKVASSASAPIYRSPQRQNPEFFAIVAPLLDALRAGCIVDVGANIGTYTLNFRKRSQAPIVAFEPEPFCFSLLSENVRANKLLSVTVRNLACGDAKGQLRFHSGINGSIAEPAEIESIITVPVVRLDDELRTEQVALIKIDCEGYEWHVLTGCRDIIAAQRPLLFIELHPNLIEKYGHTPAQVCDLLRPYYRLEFWDADPTQRSRSRLVRFLGRYRRSLVRLAGEAQALALAATERPDQLFLLAVPR